MDPESPDQPIAGRFADGEHRLGLRVYFEDTDLSGVVYHANYLRYMERARSEMLRVVGIDQRAAFEASDGVYTVASLAIRYASPARLDDALVVMSRVTAVRAASVSIHHKVMHDTVLVAEADVVLAFVTPAGRPRRQPSAWIEQFNQILSQGKQQSR